MGSGVHWSPLESSGVHMDYMGEGKDLLATSDTQGGHNEDTEGGYDDEQR